MLVVSVFRIESQRGRRPPAPPRSTASALFTTSRSTSPLADERAAQAYNVYVDNLGVIARSQQNADTVFEPVVRPLR